MSWGISELLIICPLVFLAGFVDAIAGGGGLISLPAYLLAGLPVHFAIATNKLSSAMGVTLVTTRFALKGYIPWRLASFCVVGSLLGAHIGARAALMLSDQVFKVLMLFILPPVAFYVMKGKALAKRDESETNNMSPTRRIAISTVIAFSCGAYDGFYGPGAGTFMLLLLTAVAHLKLTEANGTTKAINMASNIAALTVFWINGRVLVSLGLTAGIFGLTGSYIGSRFFERGGAKVVKPIMLSVLTLFFIKVLTETLPALFK